MNKKSTNSCKREKKNRLLKICGFGSHVANFKAKG